VIYFIYDDADVRITASTPNRKAADLLKLAMPKHKLIEVGYAPYWLMKLKMPKLAMMLVEREEVKG